MTRKSPIGYVEPTKDPALYEAAVCADLEGIIAKRRGDPYALDTLWVKVKHRGYSQTQGRHEMFRR